MINPPKIPLLGDTSRIPAPARKAGAKASTLAGGAVDQLRGLVGPGAAPEDLAEQLREKTEQETPKYQPLVKVGQELCQALQDRTRLRRFIQEVIRPMQRQQLDSRSAATRTNDIFGRDGRHGTVSAPGKNATLHGEAPQIRLSRSECTSPGRFSSLCENNPTTCCGWSMNVVFACVEAENLPTERLTRWRLR